MTEIPYLYSRAKRFNGVVVVTQVTILIIVLQRFLMGNHLDSLIMTGIFLVLCPCYFYSKIGKPEISGSLFTVIITTTILYFMWTNEGARDEAIMAVPGIYVFSLLMSHRFIAPTVLIVILINVLAMGYVHDEGLLEFNASYSGLNSTILISLLIAISCYWGFRVHKELGLILKELQEKNEKLQASEAEILKMAQHDFLTGLPNRLMAELFFNRSLDVSEREKISIALMFIDLDGFKEINDTLGHEMGDLYLIGAANKIKSTLRKTDTVCRLGGDEFVAIFEFSGGKEDAAQMARKIIEAVNAPTSIQDHLVSCSATIGVAMIPEDGTSFDTICRKADAAMYHGKRNGKNGYHFFSDSMRNRFMRA